MPTAVQVTGAVIGQGGAFGPVEYGGKLYLISLSAFASNLTDTSEIGIFESEDNGATWSQTGSTIEIPSATDAGGDTGPLTVRDPEFLHGCFDVDWPTQPYAYIMHCGMSGGYGCLFVTRFNASTGDFDDTSAAGPQIPITGSLGSHDFIGWMIAQADDREFGVLANLNTAGSATDRVYAMSLSADLNSWSGRDLVEGQTDGQYTASGIVRGDDGRVHGWVERQYVDGFDTAFTMYHTVVIGGGGGIGSELQSVLSFFDTSAPITGPKIFQSPYTGGYLDGEVVFICAQPGSGVGTNHHLVAARATSEDEPSWTVETVDNTSNSENSYWAGVGWDGSTIDVAYNINNSFDTVRFSTFAGTAWSTPADATEDVGPYFVTTQRIAAGLGISFGQNDYDLYFVLVSGGAQTITGVEPIQTKEQFYNTSGVTGGGLDTCGTPIAVEPSNACNPVDPDTAIDAPATCVPQGFSF